MQRLSETKIKGLKWQGKDKSIAAGNGLYLRIRKASKTWLHRTKRSGKTTVTSLGTWPDMTLRQAAREASRLSETDHLSDTIMAQLADGYMREVVEPKHKRPEIVAGYMHRAIHPTLGDVRVRDVTRQQLVDLIRDYKQNATKDGRGDGARTADQLRSILTKMMGYAVETGQRPDNPMELVTRRVAGYRPVSRDRVLSDDEIRDLWHWPHPNAKVLRFLLLTGLRISEAQKGYRDGDRWIVPAEISKNGKAHWVHLTDAAAEQLLLPACTPTNIQSWLKRKQADADRYTPHDLRRTWATRASDNGVPVFIVERCLNHTLQGVMGTYNRAEYAEERIEAAKVLEKAVLNVVGIMT